MGGGNTFFPLKNVVKMDANSANRLMSLKYSQEGGLW